MKEGQIGTLTRKELIKELGNRGYNGHSERALENWEANDLLPPFDVPGRGRGRGKGRESGAWSLGNRIIEQSVCICDLLRVHKTFEGLYLPLRMRGFPIPVNRLRQALARPLYEAAREIAGAEQSDVKGGEGLGMEDMIADAADKLTSRFIKEIRRIGIDVPQFLQEPLEVVINLLLNEDFKLNGLRLKAAEEELEGWEQGRRGSDETGMHLVLKNAQFIARHFSIRQLEEAIYHTTDDEMEAVGCDLEHLHRILFSARKVFLALMAHLPMLPQPTMEDFYSFSSVIGRVFALAVISLRRGGFGDNVDLVLTEMRELPKAIERIEIDPAKIEEFVALVSGEVMLRVSSSSLKQ